MFDFRRFYLRVVKLENDFSIRFAFENLSMVRDVECEHHIDTVGSVVDVVTKDV